VGVEEWKWKWKSGRLSCSCSPLCSSKFQTALHYYLSPLWALYLHLLYMLYLPLPTPKIQNSYPRSPSQTTSLTRNSELGDLVA
jgi:hypothetical protein